MESDELPLARPAPLYLTFGARASLRRDTRTRLIKNAARLRGNAPKQMMPASKMYVSDADTESTIIQRSMSLSCNGFHAAPGIDTRRVTCETPFPLALARTTRKVLNGETFPVNVNRTGGSIIRAGVVLGRACGK